MLTFTRSTTSNPLPVSQSIGSNFKLFATNRAHNKDSLILICMLAVFRTKEMISACVLYHTKVLQEVLAALSTLHCHKFSYRCSSTFRRAVHSISTARYESSLTLRADTGLLVPSPFMLPLACTGTAKLRAAIRSCATSLASLFTAVTKILAMYFAVAYLADGNSIINFKAQLRIISPRLDMMGMQFTFRSTLLTSVVITNVDRVTPLFKLCSQSSAVSLKRFAVLPSSCLFACPTFSSTPPRTENSISIIGGKCASAIRALFSYWWIALRPTFFRTITRCQSATRYGLIFLMANLTNAHCLSLLKQLNVFDMYYTKYCREKQELSPEYCASIIQRWQEATGQQAVRVEVTP